MALKNHTYLIGRIPSEYEPLESDFTIEISDARYYFRLILDEDNQEVKFEDTVGRYVPFSFDNLVEIRDTLSKVITDVMVGTVGGDYNEVS